jgi:hypothetical protein
VKTLLLGILTALGLAGAVQSAEVTTVIEAAPSYEPVRSIPALSRLYSWQAVDEDTLIIWATAFRPYLVELSWPSHDLKFVEVIGVSESAGRVHSRFDSVYVRGINYPIDEIYELTPEQARTL